MEEKTMEATKYSCISCSLGHNLSCGHQIHPVGVALDFSQRSPALLYSVINQQYMLYNLNIGYWELDVLVYISILSLVILLWDNKILLYNRIGWLFSVKACGINRLC